MAYHLICLENVPHALEKKVCFAAFRWNVLFVKSVWPEVSCTTCVSVSSVCLSPVGRGCPCAAVEPPVMAVSIRLVC